MNLDISLILWIQQLLYTDFLASVVVFLTDKKNYIIPCALAIGITLYREKSRGLWVIIIFLVAIFLTDFVTAKILKPFFARIRPCHISSEIQLYINCSHSYSFPSIHAANTFAIATIWMLIYRNARFWIFGLAIFSAGSRVYLGVHYPSDVIAGAICGILISVLIFKIFHPFLVNFEFQSLKPEMSITPKKILIIKLSSLGDVIHTLPALHTLRKLYPNAHISWIVEEKCKDLLFQNPDLDELIVVKIRHWRKNIGLKSLSECLASLRQIRRKKYDLVLDLQGLIKTGIIAKLSGAPTRLGFHKDDCREKLNALFTNEKIPFIGKKTHVIDKNLAMIQSLGAKSIHKIFPLVIPESSENQIQSFIKENAQLLSNPLIAIHHGVGFETKRWKLENFAELGNKITKELGANIILTWGPGEKESVQKLSSMMSQKHWVAPENTMHQSMALFKRLNLFIACDTGPMHLSAALGIPTVSIFGPTDPEYSRPHGEHHTVVCKIQPCSFCHKRSCPTQNECMNEITVENVFDAVKQKLQEPLKTKIS